MATIKEINHDSSTVLADFYSTIVDTDGGLSVTAAAALGGSTNGVSIDLDAGTQTMRLTESFVFSADEFRWRMRFDLGGITNNNAGAELFSISLLDGVLFALFSIVVDANGGDSGFTVRANYRDDVSGTTSIASGIVMPSSGDTCLEIRAIKESADGAADGEVEFYINGVSQGSTNTAETFDRFDPANTRINMRSANVNYTGTYKYDEWLLTDVAGTGLCVAPLTLAPMTKPASVNADGTFIYLALLDGGTPILTKIATDLLSDGTTVFNPGAGDNIGVQCGKFDTNVVWVAGNFGGTDTVEKSENAGSSFVVKDPATFDPVTSFVVGPDSDDRVLVFADAGGSVASSNIQETTDNGASWDQKDSGLGFVSKAVERLDINIEEIVTGNEAGASDNIHYSPNTGQDLEDYSTGFPTQDVTKVIIG